MRLDFLIRFIRINNTFNKYAIPIGLLLSLLVYKDLRQFMIPIAITYYLLLGILMRDKKNRSRNDYISNPTLLLMMDMIYLTFMSCICYGWFVMILYIGGIQYE